MSSPRVPLGLFKGLFVCSICAQAYLLYINPAFNPNAIPPKPAQPKPR